MSAISQKSSVMAPSGELRSAGGGAGRSWRADAITSIELGLMATAVERVLRANSTWPLRPGPHRCHARRRALQACRREARVLGSDHVRQRVDQREVGEGLGKVPQVTPTARIDLLGIQAERAGVGD